MAGKRPYAAFERIDGRHPLRAAVPGGYVDYRARRVRGSRVLYFNFDLAREMGLIPRDHPDRLDAALRRAILDAFSVQIINEYDTLRGTRIRATDRLPRVYLASRYLQIQHPSRRGDTSGDGRSVWNGMVRARGTSWDVTSCGTGVTRLCPATAATRRYYKTGSRHASYGCGTASVAEGIAAALMSETFHRNGIPTERVLAILALRNGYAINVRAGQNLIRPSHFFAPLKQGNRAALAGVVDLFLKRQADNGAAPWIDAPAARYAAFAETMARTFGRTAARFEREYVFCWMEWDGDNVLADGGIIDYGSVRQFGLFHREYRYDDVERLSTTISEQKAKARGIVQCCAQIREFLCTGKKPPLRALARDRVLALFDEEFAAERDRLLLRAVGFDAAAAEALFTYERALVRRFDREHAYFERARSRRGPHAVSDGITWNAVFSMRDALRLLPAQLLATGRPFAPAAFVHRIASTYAAPADRRATRARRRRAGAFQAAYVALVAAAARRTGRAEADLLRTVAARSAVINRYARITGDSVTCVAASLSRARHRLDGTAFLATMRGFIDRQTLNPDRPEAAPATPPATKVDHHLAWLVHRLRHGL